MVRGAKIADVTAEISNLQETFDQVAVVVGGNDCDCTSSTTASITEDMTKLIAAAKKVGSSIKVSSILPRIQTKCSTCTSHIKMDQVNKNIKQFCSSDPACEFIDHSTNFTLSDKSVNDALFLNDGVHLNIKGSANVYS